MESSRYIGNYPPIGGRLPNQNQTASSTATYLNSIQPQQNGAIYAGSLSNGAADRSQQSSQLLRQRHPYNPYLPSKSYISEYLRTY